jgi:hypothetical protein
MAVISVTGMADNPNAEPGRGRQGMGGISEAGDGRGGEKMTAIHGGRGHEDGFGISWQR